MRPLLPKSLLHSYRIDELHEQGWTGKGATVVIPAIDTVDPADLAAFAAENNLPPFRYQVDGEVSGKWEGVHELTMDMSIIHAVAPDAKIVVHELEAISPEMIAQWAARNPGAIWSWSLGLCETQFTGAQAAAEVIQSSSDDGAVHFVSTGDSAGYDCYEQEHREDRPAADMVGVVFPASAPAAVAVGGTRLWLADGEYLRETPWYDAATMSGSGGGAALSLRDGGCPMWPPTPTRTRG